MGNFQKATNIILGIVVPHAEQRWFKVERTDMSGADVIVSVRDHAGNDLIDLRIRDNGEDIGKLVVRVSPTGGMVKVTDVDVGDPPSRYAFSKQIVSILDRNVTHSPVFRAGLKKAFPKEKMILLEGQSSPTVVVAYGGMYVAVVPPSEHDPEAKAYVMPTLFHTSDPQGKIDNFAAFVGYDMCREAGTFDELRAAFDEVVTSWAPSSVFGR